MATILVPPNGGRHVLPHQEVWPTHLFANRREPLARRPAATDRPGHCRPARPAPGQWPDRWLAHLGSTLRPETVDPLRTQTRQAARDWHASLGSAAGVRETLAGKRLPGRDCRAAARTPF